MIPVTSIIYNRDDDVTGELHPSVQFTIKGSRKTFYLDVDSTEDVLSIPEFDYSDLHTLIIEDRDYSATIDTKKLFTLPLKTLGISGKCNFGSKTTADYVISNLISLNDIRLYYFDESIHLDASGHEQLDTVYFYYCKDPLIYVYPNPRGIKQVHLEDCSFTTSENRSKFFENCEGKVDTIIVE